MNTGINIYWLYGKQDYIQTHGTTTNDH